MPFFQHRLASGVQIIGESNPAALSVSIGFFVKTGSRDEQPEESGVSHFLEHMVFKGTPRRTANDVNLTFDRLGANYNASTSEETTIFYASVLPEYIPQIVDLLADILRPSLREEDFDTEKQVILEEIGMYEDSPGYCAYDKAKVLFFGKHRLGNSILGSNESITALTADQMRKYFERRYVGSNITVAVAGNFDWPAFIREVETHCGQWPDGDAPREYIVEANGSGGCGVEVREQLLQEQTVLIAPGPGANSPMRYAAELLSSALGDSSGSRLFWALTDPGLAEYVDVSFHEYEGTGTFYTFLSCEPELEESNLELIHKIFEEVQRDGITQDELDQARNKMLSRLVRGSERTRGRMMALGMNWLYQGGYRSLDDDLASFTGVTLDGIREVLDRYPLTKVTTFALGPLEEVKTPVSA